MSYTVEGRTFTRGWGGTLSWPEGMLPIVPLDEAVCPTGVRLRNTVEVHFNYLWHWMYFEDKHCPAWEK